METTNGQVTIQQAVSIQLITALDKARPVG